MPPRIEREHPIAEAQRQLKVSLEDLANDAERYDKGDFDAINRSSATLRTIFYHNKRNKSLVQFLQSALLYQNPSMELNTWMIRTL